MADFLLEIGLEEVPAHLVSPAREQLVERTEAFLAEARLGFGKVEAFSTPRRLAILVRDLAEKAEDIELEVKGPIKRAAVDAEGNYTKAAEGFVRGQGMTTDDIIIKESNGNEHIFVAKFEAGQVAAEVLQGFNTVVEAMQFPTEMRWGRHSFQYVRPIRWMVALLDENVVTFNVLDVETGRTSRGHRFLGQEVEIKSATEYVAALESVAVLADDQARKDTIWSQIEAIGASNGWTVVPDADLLEEVNNLVEFPTAFNGNFDAKYLDLPDEVLITSMREHQRFFHVVDENGALLPHFISVRNGNDQHLDNVIAGNEKVLIARLEDAVFFYGEDQKHDIAYYNNKLKNVSFHAKLGSVADHTRRAQLLAALLADRLELDEEAQVKLAEAASIYKFDLMTGMVGEFDELQGIMGEKYALLFGEAPEVAAAIREHYMPISAGGELPSTDLGKILALADKLDTLVSFFGGEMVPSGSNDPYALRRAASGIMNILRANDWAFDLNELLIEYVSAITESEDNVGLPEEVVAHLVAAVSDINDFLTDRVIKELQDQNVRHDVINAVTQAGLTSTTQMFDSATALLAHQDDANFRDGVEGLTRIMRLTTKNPTDAEVSADLFENEAEAALFDATMALDAETTDDMLVDLLALDEKIAAYFDVTMVMVEDEEVKQNRLATLAAVSDMANQIANFMQLDVKSK